MTAAGSWAVTVGLAGFTLLVAGLLLAWWAVHRALGVRPVTWQFLLDDR